MKNLKKILMVPMLASAALGAFAHNHNGHVGQVGDTTVKLKGGLDFKYGAVSQKAMPEGEGLTANQKKSAMNTEANFRVELDRESDEGLKYGGKIVLKTTTQQDGGASVNGSHIWVSRDEFGKIEIGSPFGAARKMHLSAGEVSQGSGTVGWTDYAKLYPKNYEGMYFRDSDKLFGDQLKGDWNEPSRKINYFSPEIQGFQLGLSYTPDTYNVGDDSFSTGKNHLKDVGSINDIKNLVSYGVSYKNNLADGVDLKLAVTGETGRRYARIKDAAGNDINKKLNNLKAYNVGAFISYGNFGLAASYGNLGKNRSETALNGNIKKKTDFYSVGANYKQGPYGISLVHFGSNHRGNKLKSVSLAGSYDVARGLTTSLELTRFEAKGRYADKTTKEVKSHKPKGYTIVGGVSVSL